MSPASVRDVARELQLLRSDRLDVMFHGTTMEPLLRDGDRVVVSAVRFEDIRPGDVLTYRHRECYPTRRVVARRGDRLTMWCDNLPEVRFVTSVSEVLGRATARIRCGEILRHEDGEWQQRRSEAMRRYRRQRLGFGLRGLGRAIKRLRGS